MNILLARTGGLGDTLLTMPVANQIKNLHPDARFHILGNPMMLSVAGLFDIFDVFHSIENAGFSNLFSDSDISDFLTEFFCKFNSVYFFTAANPHGIDEKLRLAGVENIRIFNPNPVQNPGFHFSVFLSKILENNDFIDVNFDIPGINYHIKKVKKGNIVIHPGSGGIWKNWPLENFSKVASGFEKRVTFVLGPAERENNTEEILRKEGYEVEKPDDISGLCRIISEAPLYLGNDSGVSHLAGILNVPSLVLFGPTDPLIWKPLGNATRIIISPDGTMEGIRTGCVAGKVKMMIDIRELN